MIRFNIKKLIVNIAIHLHTRTSAKTGEAHGSTDNNTTTDTTAGRSRFLTQRYLLKLLQSVAAMLGVFRILYDILS